MTDGTLAAVEFIGENGSFFRKELDGNKDIRDYIENTFTNNINGTTTINAFTGVADLNNSSREIRLDLVQVELPDEFQNDTLSQIRLIDSGATGLQRIFVAGVTLRAKRESSANFDVRIIAEDGRGGVAEQSFVVAVKGDPDNNAPVIVSTPVTDFSPAGINNPTLGDVAPESISLSLIHI